MWSRDEEFCRANEWRPDLTAIQIERWLQRFVHGRLGDLIRLGVELDATLVGYVDLAKLTDSSAEFGIAIGESRRWGQGVGTAAGESLLAYAFDDLRLRRVNAFTADTNVRSLRLLTRLGFRRIHRDASGAALAFELEDHRWRSLKSIEVRNASVDEGSVVDLLSLAVGGARRRVVEAVKRYRSDRAAILLVAIVDHQPVAVAGYTVTESEATLLHIATIPHARRTGVGTRLLRELRRSVPAGLPIVAETDEDALGFYSANNFTVTSLGRKYPGVQRFRVRLDVPVGPD